MTDRHLLGKAAAADGLPGAALLSKLGHELRSPLAGILGLSRIMLVKLSAGPADAAQQTRQLDLVHASAERMLRTVERVVEAARIDGLAAGRAPEPGDCRARIAEVAERARPAADARGRQLVLDLPDEPVMIVDGYDALPRILAELVDNALRYTDQAAVRVGARVLPDRAAIYVSDDGPGMTDRDRARLGEPFERGAAAERQEVPGSGLGWYLAERLADRAGFRLLLDSTPGKGTTVTVQAGPALTR